MFQLSGFYYILRGLRARIQGSGSINSAVAAVLTLQRRGCMLLLLLYLLLLLLPLQLLLLLLLVRIRICASAMQVPPPLLVLLHAVSLIAFATDALIVMAASFTGSLSLIKSPKGPQTP